MKSKHAGEYGLIVEGNDVTALKVLLADGTHYGTLNDVTGVFTLAEKFQPKKKAEKP